MELIALNANAASRDILLLDKSGDGLFAAWERYLDGMVSRQEYSAATRTAYRNAIKQLWAWAEEQGGEMVSIDAEALLRWKAHLVGSLTSATSNLYIAGVRAFYAWANASGIFSANPAAALKSVKRHGIRKRHSRGWLSEEEAVRLLELPLEPRDAALISLMLHTGARGIELLRANLEDVRCEGSQCVLYVQGKGRTAGDKEPLVITPAAQQALDAWIRERGNRPGPLFTSSSRASMGKRLAPSSLRWLIRSALLAAGITRQGISTHSLRHTAATTLLRHGGSIRDAQSLLRHASVETTMIYAHEVDRLAAPPERWIHYGKQEAVMR